MGLTVHAELGFSRLTDPSVLQNTAQTNPHPCFAGTLYEDVKNQQWTTRGVVNGLICPIPPGM
jgi:hypothetical protein